MGYSGYTIKYIKYMGYGLAPTKFILFLIDFRHFGSNLDILGDKSGQHFLKKCIPYETSGQTHKLKLLVYGSSSYDFFIQNCRSPCKLPSKLNFFTGDLFFIWSHLGYD